ncbi:MAG: STAS domain-containing protein [Vicinamibacteria bacterium]|nr:STAS domain-containing protein [Vicinamibacteria bacterium]
MKTTERQAGDITILDVQGRIMFGDGEDGFRDAVTKTIESGRVKLVINMAEVPFVDSAGLSQLIRTYVTTGKRGGQMKLLNLTKRVRELLTITKLLTVLEEFESEEEAVASFGEMSLP